MPQVKKWSTGSVGNPHPDHSERNNPNTRGLSIDGVPGIEGYIEEDRVVANSDNRPLENLTQNDLTLESNLAAVATEVDYGVLRYKDEEFRIEVLQSGEYLNPEDDEETITITPLRIHAGQALVDGQVTSVGNQKIIYFLKDDGSYVFPDYDEHEGKTVIPITDDLYTGNYRPVYDTLPEGLPENFENYEIKITNKYDIDDDRVTFFKAYRNWEDIVPYKPNEQLTSTNLNFIYDENFGRESEGIWLMGDNVDNVKISDVVVKKNIQVRDKKLDNFIQNGSDYEQYIITDGLFFDNIDWRTETQEKNNVQDLYVDDDNNIYFTYEHVEANENLFYLPEGSTQVSNIFLDNTIDQGITRIIESNNLLFLLGTNGYFATYDLVTKTNNVTKYEFFESSTENFKYATYWEGRYWVATSENIYYADVNGFDETSSFQLIDLNADIETLSGEEDVVVDINTLQHVYGNFYVDSSLKTDITNFVKNPSFEKGGVGTTPTYWETSGTFELSPSNAQHGNYKALLSPSDEASQLIYTDLKAGSQITFSAYLKSVADSDINLIVEELDDSNVVLTSSLDTVTALTTWGRFNATTHTLTNDVSRIRIKFENISTNIVQIDAVQLENGDTVNQYVEGFSYLFVGFEKKATDAHNPPFALIDSKRIDQVNYAVGMYGEIGEIIDTSFKCNNEILFVSNNKVYSAIFLNDEDEYNRVTINELNGEELDLVGNIDEFSSIEIFNDRTYLGGKILNKAISFQLESTDDEHVITLLPPSDPSVNQQLDQQIPSYYDIRDLLGSDYKIIPAHDDVGIQVEFSQIEDIYETRGAFGEPGYYDPGKHYVLAIQIDGGTPYTTVIQMPELYNEPVSIEWIYNSLIENHDNASIYSFGLNYSKSRVDGLYSIGKNKLTRHIRGNIQRIYKQKNIDSKEYYDKGIYVILEDAILRSKFDPNIKKLDSGIYIQQPDTVGEVNNITELPASANFSDVYHVKDFGYYRWNGSEWVDTQYIYKWDLDSTEHAMREFKSKYNQPVTFTDESLNKNWVDLPITAGYNIVPGSLRVKTNTETEIGFSENEDYFVDYESGRIIRSTVENYLTDSTFEFVESPSSNWQTVITQNPTGSTIYLREKVDAYKSFDGEDIITNAYGSTYIESSFTNSGAVYQFVKPASLNVGDTFTFSVKLKSNKDVESAIAISETSGNTSAFATLNDSTSSPYKIGFEGESYNEWHFYTVSHTITNASSDYIRVEIHLSENVNVFISQAQLERNQVSTPFAADQQISRIDAGTTVYVDFTETRDLVQGVDYDFDVENRKVVYHGVLDSDTELYFDYQYEKIFNPYLFQTSIPKFDVRYDLRDDYFLYLYSGRVWAINFVLSLLSQDEENPLVIEYKYHYPRVDKIKIRNNPDQYGNYVYIVKGTPDEINPYGPYDKGTDRVTHTVEVSRDKIEDIESNEMIYEMNVFDLDYNNNDIYDRRIYVDSRENRYFNISLYPQTVGYFPYTKDFLATSGIGPLNRLNNSKIVDIIKNFDIKQLEEIGAWDTNYQIALRNKIEYPGTGLALFIDVLNGDDTNSGELFTPLKTFKKALELIDAGASPFIIVKSEALITENVEFDLDVSEIRVFAQTYARWKGNIQNKMPVVFQGFQFERHNFYAVDVLDFYYCTFLNSTVNNYVPANISFTNCKIEDSSNTFLYVKNTIYPSPFLHPYQRNVSADDGVVGNPESVATSDPESIHPGIDTFQQRVTGNPSGSYKFFRCLVDGNRDNLIRYELKESEPWISESEPWISEFEFKRSTIVNNQNLFYTNKSSQTVNIVESILWNNKETRGTETKQFDSQSNINFENCYLDFSLTADSSELNFNPNGLIFGRETCINGLEVEPGFISSQAGFENYRLRSEAQGFLTDSVCIGRAADGRDIGCYDELRERLDVEVPKKLKSYFALIGEGIHYPIILNSEKITFTLEFKPSGVFSSPAVLFDTRSRTDDVDYVVVTYNNNSGEDVVNIDQNPDNAITDPYSFKIIVANEKTRYAIISPIPIYSDAEYQDWHKISFTVNYEKTFNEKAAFDEKDKYQNIITFFHNDELAVESFLKNDLSHDEHNDLLEGDNNDLTNDWNYNDISRFITVGSTYQQEYILHGYYSELRIDNRFVNRKELEAWNSKVVPFNDPITYLNQDAFAKAFENETVNDFWTLKTKYDVGAKGHRFNKFTQKRFTYDDGELAWALTRPTTNLLENSDLTKPIFASITTDNPANMDSQGLTPLVFNGPMTIKTIGGNTFDSSTGVTIDFTASGSGFYSYEQINTFIQDELNKPAHAPSKIRINFLPDNRFQIVTSDYNASQIQIVFEQGGDAEEFGFATLVGQGNGYSVEDNQPAAGNKRYTGGKDNNIQITTGINQTMESVHDAWFEVDPEYTRLSLTSIGIKRTISTLNDENSDDSNPHKFIRIITNKTTSLSTIHEYTYSTYIYRRISEFSKEDVRFIIQENGQETEHEFDKIENIHGYWWLAQKTFTPESDTDADVGIIVKTEVEMYLDAFQLERAEFASPFVPQSIPPSQDGIIEIDKSLLTPDRGLVFFRFKPLFSYDTDKKHVLLEMLSSTEDEAEGTIADQEKGFKVWYEYDAQEDKGKIQFRSASIEPEGGIPDESAWEVIVLKQFWDEWHTVVLSYDFNVKRFIYFFDYFKNTADVSIPQYEFFTNLSIGKNAILGVDSNGEPEFALGSQAADILVKDILLTNYVTSDQEIIGWINSYEFYKESLFTTLLESYQSEMYLAIDQMNGVNENTRQIESNITDLQFRIDAIETELGINPTESAVDVELLKVRQDELRNEVYNDTIGILARINTLDQERENHDNRIIDNRNDNLAQDVLIQQNADNIAQEISDRINAISMLRNRLASTSLGEGASLIGVHDPNNKFGATNVEAVLLEVENRVATNENDISTINTNIANINTTIELMQHGDGSVDTWTVSKATNNGWNIQALRADVNSNDLDISALQSDLAQEIQDRTDADTALETSLTNYIDGEITDVSGTGRTTETIKDNYDLIQANISDIANITTNLGNTDIELNKVKDGSDGTLWSDSMNLVAHASRIADAEADITSNSNNIATNLTSITDHETRIGDVEASLTQEIQDRQNADTSIINNLASQAAGFGASLVGIQDVGDNFTSTDVEGALQEIDGKLQALAGALNWQASVPTSADLPTTGNNLNDSRVVQDDGDGNRAQYVWDGSSWVKVADVDWGDASGVVYNNTDSGLVSTDVKSALDELYARSVSPNNTEETISSTDWTSSGNEYVYDINHELETQSVAVRAVDASGNEIVFDEYERINDNVIRVHSANAVDATFTVFGAKDSYSKVVGNWTPAGGLYVTDVVHNLRTKKIMVSVFNMTTGERVGVENIETLDNNAIRIVTDNNSDVLNVFILKQTSSATTKDIDYWNVNNGMYEAVLPLALDYDVVFSFFDPSTSKTVEVDNVVFAGGILKITRTENTPIRMVVLK